MSNPTADPFDAVLARVEALAASTSALSWPTFLDGKKHRADLHALVATIRTLTAERDRAREALGPFASHAGWYDNIAGGYPDNEIPCCHAGNTQRESRVTIGDFRRARAALTNPAGDAG